MHGEPCIKLYIKVVKFNDNELMESTCSMQSQSEHELMEDSTQLVVKLVQQYDVIHHTAQSAATLHTTLLYTL